jgi:hypothetical protein
MTIQQVNDLLGAPLATRARTNGKGRSALYEVESDKSYIKVFYDKRDLAQEYEFDDGCQLWFDGVDLLRVEPLVPHLAAYDPNPEVSVGIAVFKQIGLSTNAESASARDDLGCPLSICCFARGVFDEDA